MPALGVGLMARQAVMSKGTDTGGVVPQVVTSVPVVPAVQATPGVFTTLAAGQLTVV